jgi:3-phenylpropionate/trans-cinnamate dioxygenase ferredoxin subunit
MAHSDDRTDSLADSLAGPRFIAVARLSDIPPGGLRRVEVEGRLILLTSVEGRIYAVDDDCTHISGPLDQGELEGHVLTCPIHLARFDVRDGSVLRGPARDPLPTYPVRIEGDQVLVGVPGGDQW